MGTKEEAQSRVEFGGNVKVLLAVKAGSQGVFNGFDYEVDVFDDMRDDFGGLTGKG